MSGSIGQEFSNWLHSFKTVFVLVTTADNYPDVAYGATDCDVERRRNTFDGGIVAADCVHTWYHLYTIVFTLFFGTAVVSLIIAVFESTYGALSRHEQTRQRLKRRQGILAAFILLDKDGEVH